MKSMLGDRDWLKKLFVLNRYYRRSGFYVFMLRNAIKLLIIIALIITAVVVLERYIIDVDVLFQNYVAKLNTTYILIVFLISESILGMIPPDLFILWSQKFTYPYLMVGLLSIFSYLGGIVAYHLGVLMRNNKKINAWVSKRYEKHVFKIHRWGGVFVIVAALFPLPFAAVSTISGLVNYSFRLYLYFALARIIRFFLYAIVLFSVL